MGSVTAPRGPWALAAAWEVTAKAAGACLWNMSRKKHFWALVLQNCSFFVRMCSWGLIGMNFRILECPLLGTMWRVIYFALMMGEVQRLSMYEAYKLLHIYSYQILLRTKTKWSTNVHWVLLFLYKSDCLLYIFANKRKLLEGCPQKWYSSFL